MRLNTGLNTELRRDAAVLLAALAALLAWDGSALDLVVMRAVGNGGGFAWRHHWLTEGVLHDGARALGFVVLTTLVIGIWRPLPFARRLSRGERATWVATLLLCAGVIALLKRISLTSCPWSLAEFGGTAQYVTHWQWSVHDGGGGACFPSGHASTAFCLLSGWFALRRAHPRAARRWLACTLLGGTMIGVAQSLRGAHYPSHSLWTGWICWAVCMLCHHATLAVPRAPDQNSSRCAALPVQRGRTN